MLTDLLKNKLALVLSGATIGGGGIFYAASPNLWPAPEEDIYRLEYDYKLDISGYDDAFHQSRKRGHEEFLRDMADLIKETQEKFPKVDLEAPASMEKEEGNLFFYCDFRISKERECRHRVFIGVDLDDKYLTLIGHHRNPDDFTLSFDNGDPAKAIERNIRLNNTEDIKIDFPFGNDMSHFIVTVNRFTREQLDILENDEGFRSDYLANQD